MTYDCKVVKVMTATKFLAKLDGVQAKETLVFLDGVESPPKSSWAFEKGRRFLHGFGPGEDPKYPIQTKIRVNAVSKTGAVVGEFLYVGTIDNFGELPEPEPSDFPITDDLLRRGMAYLTKPHKQRSLLQAEAQKQALGMWTKTMAPPKPGETTHGGIVKVLSPTEFVVQRAWYQTSVNFNTTPPLRVRVKDLVPPIKGSPAYASSMKYANSLCGTLEHDDWNGMIDFTASYMDLSVFSLDRDGTAVCRVSYTSYSPDTADGMFASYYNDYALDMLGLGLARIDPKAQDVNQLWRDIERRAKEARRGMWGPDGKVKSSR